MKSPRYFIRLYVTQMCFCKTFFEDFKLKKKNKKHFNIKKKSHSLETFAKFDYKLRMTCDYVIVVE